MFADQEAERLVKYYENEIESKVSEKVGQTKVFLEGSWRECRLGECAMGNVVTDAYVHGFIALSKWNGNQTGWTQYPIAITCGGDIRNSIDYRINDGLITLADVLSVVPFGNSIQVVVVSGTKLKSIFENSAAKYNPTGDVLEGRFLQVSGIRVTYDYMKPVGSRVIALRARCGSTCMVPKFEDVQEDQMYSVIVTNYLAKGGDCYSAVCEKDVQHIEFELLDFGLLKDYIHQKSPITTGREDRITVIGNSAHTLALPILAVLVALASTLI